jgi:dephospho-CoA kinase
MMRVIGLIGGIGSGKSTAASMLRELGAALIDADKVGHEVYAPGTPGFAALCSAFGEEVLTPDGSIDRRALGARVFADAAELARLNAIVHPLIRDAIRDRVEALRKGGRYPVVVIEAAVLLEAGWRSLVEEVWLVTASRSHATERLQAQRGLSTSDIESRMARQMSDAERRAAADVVIENDGTIEDLRAALGALWAQRLAR